PGGWWIVSPSAGPQGLRVRVPQGLGRGCRSAHRQGGNEFPAPTGRMSTNADILRYIDSIARDKEIDKDSLFLAIEQAVAQALAKKYGIDDLEIKLDRDSGQWV